LLLEKRVAIITGGAKGMGKATALKFAGEGCDVVIADLQMEEAKKVAAQIEKTGRKALAVKVDISKKADVDEMAAQVITPSPLGLTR
jgi:NAD(P)-dependent dehydrogenase (short-subunit alcohol dehydrogenase family)